MPILRTLTGISTRLFLMCLCLLLAGSLLACDDPYSKPPPNARFVKQKQAVASKKKAAKTNKRAEPPKLLPARRKAPAPAQKAAKPVPRTPNVAPAKAAATGNTAPAKRDDVDTSGLDFKMDTPSLGGKDNRGLGLGKLKLNNSLGGGMGSGNDTAGKPSLGGGLAANAGTPSSRPAPTTRPAGRPVAGTKNKKTTASAMFSKKFLQNLGLKPSSAMGGNSSLEVPDVIAIVNNQKIRKPSFKLAISAARRLMAASGVPAGRMGRLKRMMYKKVLNTLIDQTLLYQHARQKGYSHTSDANRKMMGMVLTRLKSNPRLMAHFMSAGMTRKEVIESLQRQVVTQQYLKTLAKGIKVDNNKLLGIYKKTLGRKKHEVRQILISVDVNATPDKKQAALAKAMKLLKTVKQFPAQFASLAKKHSGDSSASSGGSLGYLTQGETIKALDDVIFAMGQGEIRGPVKTPLGYHILQVTAVKKPVPFGKVRFRLAYRAQMMELQKLMTKEAKALREGATIQVLAPWGR